MSADASPPGPPQLPHQYRLVCSGSAGDPLIEAQGEPLAVRTARSTRLGGLAAIDAAGSLQFESGERIELAEVLPPHPPGGERGGRRAW